MDSIIWNSLQRVADSVELPRLLKNQPLAWNTVKNHREKYIEHKIMVTESGKKISKIIQGMSKEQLVVFIMINN